MATTVKTAKLSKDDYRCMTRDELADMGVMLHSLDDVERLVASLDVLPRLGGFLKSKRHTRGLRFVATDIGHEVGDGAEVRGSAEALILAMSGRPVSLPELDGDGVDVLRSRIAA